MKELDKIQIVNKNSHEIKQEILEDCEGEFEMVGTLKVGDKLILNLEILVIMKLILTLSMRDMMLKMLFSMVIFIKSILHNLVKSIDLNVETVVVLIK